MQPIGAIDRAHPLQSLLVLIDASFTRSPSPEIRAHETVTVGLRLGAMWAQRLIARSGATKSVMRVLAQQPSTERAVASMRLLRALSKVDENAAEIVGSECFEDLIALLERPLRDPTLGLAIETLWNLLDTQRTRVSECMVNAGAVAMLTRLHKRTMANMSREAVQELRNEVVLLGTLLAQGSIKMRTELIEGGWYAALLDLVCGNGTTGQKFGLASNLNLEVVEMALQFVQVGHHASTPVSYGRDHHLDHHLARSLRRWCCLTPNQMMALCSLWLTKGFRLRLLGWWTRPKKRR